MVATGGYDYGAATPAAVAIGAVAAETLVAVVATLGAAVTSAAVTSSLLWSHHDEKPTRTRVGFSVSTAYHDRMPTDSNCPMCQTVAELERAERRDLVWHFPHSIAIVGPWQFYTGYCVLLSRDHATELSQLGLNRRAFLDEMSLLAEAIEDCFQPHKLNYELLGNHVPHLHWHLFPRYADDPERLQPVWLALERAKSDPAEKTRLETGVFRPPRSRASARLAHAAQRGRDVMNSAFRIGTRGSPLALWQANFVAASFAGDRAARVELVTIETHGDRDQVDRPGRDGRLRRLHQGDPELACSNGRVDVAVHSLKDLPTIPEPGLELVAGAAARADRATRSSRASIVGSTICPRARRSAPAACAAGPSCSIAGPTSSSSTSAATSIRGCANSTSRTSTRSSSPRPASCGSASPTASPRSSTRRGCSRRWGRAPSAWSVVPMTRHDALRGSTSRP